MRLDIKGLGYRNLSWSWEMEHYDTKYKSWKGLLHNTSEKGKTFFLSLVDAVSRMVKLDIIVQLPSG